MKVRIEDAHENDCTANLTDPLDYINCLMIKSLEIEPL
jgi:hypothetical protein